MKAIIKTNDLIAAQTSIGKDKSRAILTGVNVRVEKNRATVAATDSYRLVVIESEHADNEPGEVTIDLSGIKLKKNQLAVVEATEDSASLTLLGGVKCELPAIDGNYPNYRQLMPEPGTEAAPTSHIGFNPSFVTDLGKAYRAWSDEAKAPIWFELRGAMKPMSLEKVDGERRFFGIVMPVRISESDLALKQPKTSAPKDSDSTKRVRELEKELKAADKLIGELRDRIHVLENEPSDMTETEQRIEEMEAKLEEAAKAVARKPETDAKVDALIAEYSGITVAGKTSCAVYLGGIEKNSPEMEAAKAAGARFGNHKKYGKCWYMPL